MLFLRPDSSSLVDGFTLLGSTLLHCGAVLRGLQAAFLFHLLLCSFFCLTALFPEGTVLLRIKIAFCSKDLLPSVIKSDL